MGRGPQEPDAETRVLEEGVAHLILNLERFAGEQAAQSGDGLQIWWQQLWQLLMERREELESDSAEFIANHRAAFDPKIDEAAQSLFLYLQDHPTTLNSLRAARVTADAAAVVLALKTGGISPNDLILTPALLAVTSMLAEGAVGHYMQTVEADLKKSQLESVEQYLSEPLQQVLAALAQDIQHKGLYGLSSSGLAEADQVLADRGV